MLSWEAIMCWFSNRRIKKQVMSFKKNTTVDIDNALIGIRLLKLIAGNKNKDLFKPVTFRGHINLKARSLSEINKILSWYENDLTRVVINGDKPDELPKDMRFAMFDEKRWFDRFYTTEYDSVLFGIQKTEDLLQIIKQRRDTLPEGLRSRYDVRLRKVFSQLDTLVRHYI